MKVEKYLRKLQSFVYQRGNLSENPDKAKELLELCWKDAREPIDFDFMRQFKDRLGCTPVTRELTK